MRRARLLPLAILAAFVPTPARAEPPARTMVRLEYRPAPGCPEQKLLGYLIGSKMSFDPIDPGAKARLTVTIKHVGSMYTGVAEVREPGAAKPWVRSLRPMTSCDEMFDALAFVIAVYLDPGGPPPPAPASPATPTPAPLTPAPPLPEHPPLPSPELPSRSIRLGLGAALGLGVSPASAAPGVAVDVGVRSLRWAPLSLALEGRAYPTATGMAESSGARVTTGLYTGALVPCAHWRVVAPVELAGCALVELGALRATSDAAPSKVAVLLHAAAGLRGGVEVPLVDHLALRATGDALLSLRRSGALIDGRPAWEMPVVSAAFGLSAVASF